jgi:hypothetical protein
MIAVIALTVILILGTLMVTQFSMKKNKKQIRFRDHREMQETDLLRRSMDSIASTNQHS